MIGWVDLETTGLNPDYDEILEVALVVTTDELAELLRHQVVLCLPTHGLEFSLTVARMHTVNGLLLECGESPTTPRQAEQELLSVLINEAFPPGTLVMGGSTISFDRSFLKRWMPELEAFFHYRNLDVSTLKRCHSMWLPELAPPPMGRDQHRAVPDIEDSIAVAAYYRNTVFKETP